MYLRWMKTRARLPHEREADTNLTALLPVITSHLTGSLPSEGCGLVVCANGSWCLLPCENALASSARGRSAFEIAPGQVLAALRQGTIEVVFHSHLGCARLSVTDRRGAISGLGKPWFPDALHLVVSMCRVGSKRSEEHGIGAGALYSWSRPRERFRLVAELVAT